MEEFGSGEGDASSARDKDTDEEGRSVCWAYDRGIELEMGRAIEGTARDVDALDKAAARQQSCV